MSWPSHWYHAIILTTVLSSEIMTEMLSTDWWLMTASIMIDMTQLQDDLPHWHHLIVDQDKAESGSWSMLRSLTTTSRRSVKITREKTRIMVLCLELWWRICSWSMMIRWLLRSMLRVTQTGTSGCRRRNHAAPAPVLSQSPLLTPVTTILHHHPIIISSLHHHHHIIISSLQLWSKRVSSTTILSTTSSMCPAPSTWSPPPTPLYTTPEPVLQLLTLPWSCLHHLRLQWSCLSILYLHNLVLL